MYLEAKTTFIKACEKEGIDFTNSKICEIGLGTGFYTQILSDLNVKSYNGFDIADVLIPQLKNKFSSFNFEKKDISTHLLGSIFDVTIIIDVVQHIVNHDKFRFAIKNITEHLSPGGTLVIGPLGNKNFKKLFYVYSWTISDVKNIIGNGFKISEPVPFRNAHLFIIKKL
jgi:2-polyprenyl-3-methyl-5-hydroxy-6-metoxy-1,4-benzoquinol methylase